MTDERELWATRRAKIEEILDYGEGDLVAAEIRAIWALVLQDSGERDGRAGLEMRVRALEVELDKTTGPLVTVQQRCDEFDTRIKGLAQAYQGLAQAFRYGRGGK